MDGSVAKVAVDIPLTHLDRLFDYRVPEALDTQAVVGSRVKVRFAGRLRDGFVIERTSAADRDQLLEIAKVVSSEPVLTPAVSALVRSVADHYAGTFADVVRTAVPPRHAATEKATTEPRPAPIKLPQAATVLSGYPEGPGLLEAIRSGGHPRAAWTVVPSPSVPGDWAAGFTEAAAASLSSGRGALLLVPDARQLERLEAACVARFGAGSFAVLSADAGPSARYRAFLAASRGQVRLVLGTRAAVFAPVADLGLIALWDDGNDSYSEPHAPYWHAREVAALRAHQESAALLLAAHGRSAEVQQLLGRGWLAPLELAPQQVRRLAAAVRPVAGSTARDPLAEVTRIPKDAFEVIRTGLTQGPVLVQVPRAGYLPVLVCSRCREVARCSRCGQGLRDLGSGPACPWCGPGLTAWQCAECGGRTLRNPVVGVARTAEELGRAFPGTKVVQAGPDKTPTIDQRSAIVLATPGTAPEASAGYAACILLDVDLMLARADLRVGEESLRRWLAAVAKVRPAAEGGTVLAVGNAAHREVQALVRLDPGGYAVTEVAERAQAGFPPAVKLITIEGPAAAVADVAAALTLPAAATLLGPFALGGEEDLHRVTLRAPLDDSGALVAAVKSVLAVRTARKEAPVRVCVDPQVLD
jgi:primosomal protein N' (replication factor Y)